MGRVIRREVIAVRCELKTCGVMAVVVPMLVAVADLERKTQLGPLADGGWGFVLGPQLRSYCPDHRHHVWSCTCRTNPERRHLCTQHSVEASHLVWLAEVTDQLQAAA